MNLRIKPLADKLIVRQDATRDNITTAGIIVKESTGIVTSQQQLGRQGTVYAAGPDTDGVKLGDRVIYGEFEYPTYIEDWIEYRVLSIKDIAAVVDA